MYIYLYINDIGCASSSGFCLSCLFFVFKSSFYRIVTKRLSLKLALNSVFIITVSFQYVENAEFFTFVKKVLKF